MEKNTGFTRNVLEGIFAHSLAHKDWIYYDSAPSKKSIESMIHFKVDGVIGHFYDKALVETIQSLNLPVVNVTDSLTELNVPLADVNHIEVGKMAGNYLKGLGYQHFGFVGSGVLQYAKLRLNGFQQVLSEHKVEVCHVEYLPTIERAKDGIEARKTMTNWLHHLNKPMAIFCTNDIIARDLADICLELGVHVPNEVSILGVDNDFVECRLARPPISSITIPSVAVGYAAAEMLADMIFDRPIRHQGHFSPPPIQVFERESTKRSSSLDEHVSKVMCYIDENLAKVQEVDELVALVPLSRRNLENRFKKAAEISIWNYVLERRIYKARGLLLNKNLTIEAIAEEVGFASARRFGHTFQKLTNLSPSAFRKLYINT